MLHLPNIVKGYLESLTFCADFTNALWIIVDKCAEYRSALSFRWKLSPALKVGIFRVLYTGGTFLEN